MMFQSELFRINDVSIEIFHINDVSIEMFRINDVSNRNVTVFALISLKFTRFCPFWCTRERQIIEMRATGAAVCRRVLYGSLSDAIVKMVALFNNDSTFPENN